MREEVIRELVTRLMSDEEFRDTLLNKPGSIIKGYALDDDEVAALKAQVEGGGLNMLEQRLSATMGKNVMLGAAGDCGCGCVKPKRCDECA